MFVQSESSQWDRGSRCFTFKTWHRASQAKVNTILIEGISRFAGVMRQHLGLIVITAVAAAVYIFPAFLLENSLQNRQGFTRFPSQNYPVELPLPPPKVCVNHHIAMSEWHDSGTHRVSVFNHSVRLTSSPNRITLLIGLSGEVQAEALPVVRVCLW